MKITKSQLRSIISEAITTVSDQAGPAIALKDYSDDAIQAAAYAVKKVPYPQGGMIENEIHNYLESELGLDSAGDEIFAIADEALSVAGIMLGVGPDIL